MIARLERRSERRRGVASLIEVLASIVLTASIFGASVGLIGLLVRMERSGREDLAATMTEGRLALDLRADVHGATDATLKARNEVDSTTRELNLTMPGGVSVVYQVRGDDLLRHRHDSDGKRRVETYRFGPRTSVRWESNDRAGATLITLVLERPATSRSEAPSRITRIDAVLGHDHRFEEPE